MLQTIVDTIRSLVTWVEVMLKYFCIWLWDGFWALLTGFLEMLDLPVTDILDWNSLEPVAAHIYWADQYVPVLFGLQLLGIYWTWKLALLPIRWIARHMPFVGGG